ncbi:transmembrane and ubiquitin-like domain-containing protein 1 [Stigmatopora nigra]
MSLIEGVGDEVTLLLVALTAAAVLLLAWASTRTSEHPRAPPTPAAPAATETPPTAPSPDSAASAPDPAPAPRAPPPVDDKGDEAAPSEDSQRNMVVRLKFLNDTERTARVKPQDTVGYIKRTYFSGQERHVRLIYQGQLLRDDDATLEALRLPHNCVLHCHVLQRAAGTGAAGGAAAAEQVQAALNVGGLMVPLLGLMLAVLWYCQIQYRHLFTAPASASLLGVTVFLSLLALGIYRR